MTVRIFLCFVIAVSFFLSFFVFVVVVVIFLFVTSHLLLAK